ncbi:MAG: nucleotidyl transferase AbiEii/AbiGii toxin family protein [bacterium]|nr:nucleotidyl transferase AbiEii/AbiGii toxin family protein [bacterium]
MPNDKHQHEQIMSRILFDIFKSSELKNLLAFKGGTACYFLYDLPRFSVDLDFNLLDSSQADQVFGRMTELLKKYGTIKDGFHKRHTLFFLLSYHLKSWNIKVEINTRAFSHDQYVLQHYLGLPLMVLDKPFITAHKLAAITDRKHLAMRDLFDTHYFLKHLWPIDEDTIRERTGMNIKEYFQKLVTFIGRQKPLNILQGLGELLDEKQKIWAKEHLVEELLFYLRAYGEKRGG